MKQIYLIIFIGVLMITLSCEKANITPPLPPQPIITDTIIESIPYSLAGQTWVINQYRVGEFGNYISSDDTIEFIDFNSYTYNGFESPYSFYPTSSTYNLTLNFTPYGNISGTIYQGNLNAGIITGLKFTDISMGSGNGTNYYFWMERL